MRLLCPWEGLETSISGVLHLLIESAVACEEEMAASGDGLAELDVESALQAAESADASGAAEGLERAVQASFCVLQSIAASRLRSVDCNSSLIAICLMHHTCTYSRYSRNRQMP